MPEACVLHVTSEAEGEASKRRLAGVPIFVVPNGVDVPETVELRQRPGDVRFLYLGRLHPIKGLDTLIDACDILEGSGGIGMWSVTVAGTGSGRYRGQLEGEVARRGLSHRIRFVGEVVGEEKRKLFTETDVLILPSRAESFGMVVAEALAHAIPVIASNRTPWSDLEKVGCGLWSDDNPKALATSMEEISGMRLEEMGAKGRRWMQEEFDWDVISERMASCYRRVIGR
jgi:glycosyltransferase involved in cell wall biosynthesis